MNKADSLIQECIDQLADDRVDSGVEALYELATMWKSAGATRASFADICSYIEREAADKSDETFIQVKIANALTRVREQKSGSILLRPIH